MYGIFLKENRDQERKKPTKFDIAIFEKFNKAIFICSDIKYSQLMIIRDEFLIFSRLSLASQQI